MNDRQLTSLSLFTGAGGGELAWQHLLGNRTLGYVEWDDYCQRVLRQRIRDGVLHDAPIFGDIRAFIDQGYARRYRGVDCVAAGFPCQPFSLAGQRRGVEDNRNMWPSTVECIRLVRPKHLLLENVADIISTSYWGVILGDLAALGYNLPWDCIPSAAVGARILRNRMWSTATTGEVDIADSIDPRSVARYAPALWRWAKNNSVRSCLDGGAWAREPGLARVAYGISNRVDRLKALGNGQVPIVAATAWRLLTEGIKQ